MIVDASIDAMRWLADAVILSSIMRLPSTNRFPGVKPVIRPSGASSTKIKNKFVASLTTYPVIGHPICTATIVVSKVKELSDAIT